MTTDATAGTPDSDAEACALALIESGIEHAQSGSYIDASDDLLEARRIASAAGLDGLVTAAQINLGYAHTLQGDAEGAARLYETAADLARSSDDTVRLKIALRNLSIELASLQRHEENIATLTEYMALVGDDDARPYTHACLNRAASYVAVGEQEQALADFDEAYRSAEEVKDSGLLYAVRMSQGYHYALSGQPAQAYAVLEQAVEIAEFSGSAEEIRDARLSIAHAARMMGDAEQAARLFADAEDACRGVDDPQTLAEALYWHGVVLQSIKQTSRAIQRWDEASAIRRKLGQDGHLADCLFAKAEALRASGNDNDAEPSYAEASAIYDEMRAGVLAKALYGWGQSLWAQDKPGEAVLRADEAIRAASASGDTELERRAQGLKAMAAADAGNSDAAFLALAAAETLCRRNQEHSAMVWALARRAYVSARSEREPDEVVQQLRKAHDYGIAHAEYVASRNAVRKIGSYIVKSCDTRYHEPLAEFRTEQLLELKALESAAPPVIEQPAEVTSDGPEGEPTGFGLGSRETE